MFGLVAESTSTLCSELPSRAIELPDDAATNAQRAWERELARLPASAPPANVTLHLRVHASTARDFRHWEAIYLRHRGTALRNTSFLRFACELFLDTWRPRRTEVDYTHVYERDRHRCQRFCFGFRRLIRLATTTPPKAARAGLAGFACTVAARASRRDVTPHHLRFRAHGGDDSDENLTSLCTWCHLEGLHGGQISATPPASNIRWTFGRNAHTVVEGRRRVRASE